MDNEIKLKNIAKQYQGQSHDVYMVWLHRTCKNIQTIKKFLYNYCKDNNIDTYMGIDYIRPCNDYTAFEFYIIKD